MEFYRRNYIEGLLSSGIINNPTFTMELIYHAIYKLRFQHHFQGYIHVKAIPGADPLVVQQLGFLAPVPQCRCNRHENSESAVCKSIGKFCNTNMLNWLIKSNAAVTSGGMCS